MSCEKKKMAMEFAYPLEANSGSTDSKWARSPGKCHLRPGTFLKKVCSIGRCRHSTAQHLTTLLTSPALTDPLEGILLCGLATSLSQLNPTTRNINIYFSYKKKDFYVHFTFFSFYLIYCKDFIHRIMCPKCNNQTLSITLIITKTIKKY